MLLASGDVAAVGAIDVCAAWADAGALSAFADHLLAGSGRSSGNSDWRALLLADPQL